MSGKFVNIIKDVRTYKEADYNSNHYLLTRTYNVKLKIGRQEVRRNFIRYKVSNLNKKICRKFKMKMRSLALKTDMNKIQTIETRWKDVKNLLKIC